MSNKKQPLSQRDFMALKSIYDFRVLSFPQLYELHYQETEKSASTVSDAYCRKKVNLMARMGLLEKQYHNSKEVLFLTSKGIDFIKKQFDLPANIYDYKKKVVKRGYYRASELKVSGKYINHQLHLNQFMIDFMKLNVQAPFQYYDEKHISSFNRIRPDALLHTINTDFFIEIDMSTESKKQLIDKWDNYRQFLASKEFEYIEHRIVVLFIIENPNQANKRIDLVKKTIEESFLEQVNHRLEIYVDTHANILKYLKRTIAVNTSSRDAVNNSLLSLLNKNDFSIIQGDSVSHLFDDTRYAYYIQKARNGELLIENNRIQEFVVDTYMFSPLSVISKIAYLDFVNSFFNAHYKRDIAYIVVASSEERLYHDLEVLGLIDTPNVYFTTLKRLSEKPFHEALFRFDFLGNVHSFTNSGLHETVFDYSLTKKES